MDHAQVKDEDVLFEQIEYVIDLIDDKILDLLWSRIVFNDQLNGWIIYNEEYSQTRRPEPENSAHVRRTIPLTDACAARALFEGLQKHLAA